MIRFPEPRVSFDRITDLVYLGSRIASLDDYHRLKAQSLDAILFPGGTGAGIAAKPGYPTVIVPFGTVPNAPTPATFPEGFAARPAPLGVSFTGTACSEPRLLALAYAFEQATRKRVPPPAFP